MISASTTYDGGRFPKYGRYQLMPEALECKDSASLRAVLQQAAGYDSNEGKVADEVRRDHLLIPAPAILGKRRRRGTPRSRLTLSASARWTYDGGHFFS